MHKPAGSPRLGTLSLAALGVVYGDIGTSPLYTMHECMSPERGVPPTPGDVLGVLSLITWSLTLVVSVKYLTAIMRADNHGEGGIFALLALVPGHLRSRSSGRLGWAALLVLFGAGLLYGDGIITPAISVLSAVEGLKLAAPGLERAVLPLTCAILAGLFAFQRRGTGRVGKLFGPIMLVWFVSIGALGARQVVHRLAVLAALNPLHAARFFAAHGAHGLLVLGSVVLAVTGAEALYADMGHFGARPIRLGWFALVKPALLLNYLGQGALLLSDPAAARRSFFAMVPAGGWTLALVALSTAATIIASQALITGAFSLTRQAVQLGFFPRVTVTHTSREQEGQIYVPEINWGLAIACISLVLVFEHSSRLAAAYGVAVTGTMLITSIIYFEVARATWKWPLAASLPLLVLFLAFDVPFFVATLSKFVDGGFVPVAVALALFVMMVVWRRGRTIYAQHLAARATPLAPFLAQSSRGAVTRPPGTGVVLTSDVDGVPAALLHLVERLRVLPETVILLTMKPTHVPYASPDDVKHESLGGGVHRLVVERGFMQGPDVPTALAAAARRFGIDADPAQVTYYASRETFRATSAGAMGRWSEALFAFLARNSRPATAGFCLPPDRVVEIGSQVDL